MSLLHYDNNVNKYLLRLGSQYKCMFVNYRSECEFSDYHFGIKSRSLGIWMFTVRWTDISSLGEVIAHSSELELRRLLSSERYCVSIEQHCITFREAIFWSLQTITSETPQLTGWENTRNIEFLWIYIIISIVDHSLVEFISFVEPLKPPNKFDILNKKCQC